uniref:Carboxypeptidase n=1 Tax=Meloidogyne incognita TaxID=6306 RepID=A0A914MIZ2_MELIC
MPEIFFWVLQFCILINLIYGSSKINNNPDEIKSLPGLNATLNFKHYSGYLNAGNNNLFHYMFVESQGNPKTDPLVLWLNGGPGCSSLEGIFEELGPYLINKDGKTLRQNPYSWNKYASIIFLESPAWVGFSYNTKSKNILTNDDEVAVANYAALKDFFNKYPSFNSNPFYLAGESYAGVYIPMLGVKILESIKDTKINLKGVAIGNGILSNILNTNTLPLYLYGHGLVDEEVWQKFQNQCCNGCIDGCDILSIPENTTCGDMQMELYPGYTNDLLNPYDIYDNCDWLEMIGHYTTVQFPARMITSQRPGSRKNGSDHPQGICFCFLSRQEIVSATEHYLNMPDVQKALNILSNLNIKWEECSDDIYNNYTTIYKEMANFTKTILKANIRMILYYGDLDVICNFLIGQRFTEQLGFELKTPKQAWIVNEQVGGFTTEYKNGLTFNTGNNKRSRPHGSPI